MSSVQTPAIPIHDPRFEYTPSDATDVRRTWARYGWKPRAKSAPGAYPCHACVGLRRHDEPHTCKAAGQYIER
jgi:hypothetical protein